MKKKSMPLSVKAIMALHSFILAVQLLFLLNQAVGFISHHTIRNIWSGITAPPFSVNGIIFFSCIFVMILTIYGFLNAKPYARNLTITFYGLLVLKNGINLLHPFTVPYMRGWEKLVGFGYLALLCLLIFLFYLALRTDVHDYCQQSD